MALPTLCILKSFTSRGNRGIILAKFLHTSHLENGVFVRRIPLQRVIIKRSFRSSRLCLKKDYYEVLGLSKSADKEEIKKKYRELAKKYHPDLNKDDKSAGGKFREATEAYEVLSDDKKREVYNNHGHAGVDPNFQEGGHNPFGGGFGGFGGFQQQGNGFGGFEFRSDGNLDPQDIFEMFGINMGGGERRRKGKDVKLSIDLSFLEAVTGCEKEVKFEYVLRSDDKKNNKGTRKSRAVKLDVPAGVDSGITMRVGGKGEEGPNNLPPGDLLVSINVAPDPYFRREEFDVHVDIPISIAKAALGGSEEVLTLDGLVDLKVPAATQPGSTVVMRSKGIKHVNNHNKRGNQVIHFIIKIPTSLTSRQKELLQEFEEEEKKKINWVEGMRSFSIDQAWKRLKKFLGDNACDKTAASKSDKGEGGR